MALADTVTVCEVVTEATVAVNEAEDAPDAMVTLAGTVTAELELARPTLTADRAAELSETVQEVEPAPVNELVPHESALNDGAAGAFNFIAKLFEVELAVADTVAVCEVVTEATVAVKDADDAPDAIVTLAGTATADLVLARPTLAADGAAELSETVQEVEPAPVNELAPHESALSDGAAGEFNWIVKFFELELALADSVAVCEVVTEATVAVNEADDAPDAIVTLAGTVTAELLLTSPTLRADGAAELSETVQEVEPAPMKELLPHERAATEGAIVDVAVDELNLIEVDLVIDPCAAVSVTVCADVTASAVAEKLTFFAPDGTVTDDGTVIWLLLLARFTTMPPPGALAFRLTVHVSDPAAAIDELAQLKPERDGVEFAPLPCSFTVPETVVLELLIAVRVSWPLESTAAFGSYFTWTVMLLPALMVVGRAVTLTLNAVSELVICSILSGDVPGFSMERVCEAVWPTLTLPNSIEEGAIRSAPLLEENAGEFEPQPVMASPAMRATATRPTAPALFRTCCLLVWGTFGRPAAMFMTSRTERVRYSYIGITCATKIWRSRHRVQKVRAYRAAGKRRISALVTNSRIALGIC